MEPGARAKLDEVLKPRASGDWAVTNCVQHLLKGKASAEGFKVFGVVQDGGNMGRRKATAYLGFNPSNCVGSVGAPQDLGTQVVKQPEEHNR